MEKQFINYITQEKLIQANEQILIAVSGGIDSMVLLQLFQKTYGTHFAVAHCNFKLRASESDLDEQFITDYCNKHQIPLFVKPFNTTAFAKQNGISIQMAARQLRYEWFEHLSVKHNYSKIALAQHLDDQTETFFINLMRGTGIAGIHGILPLNGKLIRPLLFIDRKGLEAYQQQNKIPFREDESNKSNKYIRNYIRHNIIPEFENIAPNFSQKLDSNIKNFKEVEDFYKHTINKNLKSIINKDKLEYSIRINDLLSLDFIELHLRELLVRFHFSTDAINKVYLKLKSPSSGKIFESNTHRVLIDRDFIIIREKTTSDVEEYLVYENKNIDFPITLKNEVINNNHNSLVTASKIGLFSYEKIEFPLIIRKWKHSDYFYPFGMNGKKKLSDYFIDNKFTSFQKEDTWVLTSGKNIIWVIGERTDNRYRISKRTEKILKITLKDGIN